MDGSPEYLLVLSHSPNGCLQDYLRSNPIDWPTFCRMALSIAKGLAHLHTDMRKGGIQSFTNIFMFFFPRLT